MFLGGKRVSKHMTTKELKSLKVGDIVCFRGLIDRHNPENGNKNYAGFVRSKVDNILFIRYFEFPEIEPTISTANQKYWSILSN